MSIFLNFLPLKIVVSGPDKVELVQGGKFLYGITDIVVDTEPSVNFGLRSLFSIKSPSYAHPELGNMGFCMEIDLKPENEPITEDVGKLSEYAPYTYYNLKLKYNNKEITGYDSFHFSANINGLSINLIYSGNKKPDMILPNWIVVLNDES